MASSVYSPNIFWDIIKKILFFPFWWYSFGLIEIVSRLKNLIAEQEKSLGLFIWIKNVFIPMYGQRDLPGILISLFMRIFQIIFRTIVMIVWIIIVIAIFWIWIAAPIFIVYQIVWQLT